ncbi:SDR family oxidoreductase [Zooshikella ganghwensis]|uniref:SDR family oxidoreductase n=1 Tax=Zooshikella ganghwensis TaxID=202772 RepID=UPI0004080290|nr:SDR family oxidoreductase [Zooshikella ganghwensis]
MKYFFRNKVVVITGACAGIGRQLCLRFARAGAWIVAIDLDQSQLDALVNHIEALNTRAMGLACDVSREADVDHAFNSILDQFKKIDVLINNAGITHRSAFIDTDIAVFRRVLDVNFFGALYCTKVALPALLDSKGLVITLSSMSGFTPMWFRSGYSASKHALHGLFESLRLEVEESGVSIMMVCPGFTATDIHKNALEGDGSITKSPFSLVGQLASPVDVADEIYQAASKRKRLVVLSNVGRRARMLSYLCPHLFERLMLKVKREQQGRS